LARLIITAADGTTTSFALVPGETVVGRASANDVVLDSDGVSRRHVRFLWSDGAFTVEDLGSKNGTLLNGGRLEGRSPLKNGDAVTVPGWTLKFEAEEETVTRSATPASAPTLRGQRAVLLKPETREVVVRGTAVLLPPKEYLALTLLYERAGTIVSKEDLAEHVWPEYKGDVSDYNIHQVLSRLRRELEEDPAHPRLLVTRPGFGYMLVG
jgi:pSer/pThr/pTyr-binding forkhead associated (FHA) protein